METKRLVNCASIAAACCIAVLFALIYATVDSPEPINPMKIVVSNVALGSTTDEADEVMGVAPMTIVEYRGYLLSPVTMLAADNELTPKDKIKTYSLRTYQVNGNWAVVAIDSDGLVAGRWDCPKN